ncbi:sigma-54-dependent Fis family transcriptional regulator [Alphaproteobacteria bacterium KMM 3653]|uniref:Sigma-54-dependent Fis family transcriptional regulator n=1 Tax=Harenicola maris TaxID=2841044 RepID=A0AAP2CRX9_9RHOB|nr:sigma-54-dependent Fis family transcriptional regulator [Harenicola maris]
MNDFRILLIDDDRLFRNSLVDLIEAAGWKAKPLARATEAARWITQFAPDVILSDVRMPEMTGLELLKDLKNAPPVVLISAHGDIPMAVEAMNEGAYSFVEKPYDPKRLLLILSHAAEQHRMRESNQRLKERLQELSGLDVRLLGETPEMVGLRQTIAIMTQSASPVLILGETGTGKDLVARLLHDTSDRCDGPFIAINAAQVTAAQLPVVAQAAAGGTLFLDEISACPMDIQPALLRLCESQEVFLPDAVSPEKVDLRILSATNEDTAQAVRDGRLRQDLLFRLEGLSIKLPTLAARLDDIPLLAQRFLSDSAKAFGVSAVDLTQDDISALIAHSWPGNVRELRNVVDRFLMSAQQGTPRMADAISGVDHDGASKPGLREAVAAFERQMIGRAIQENAGRMDDAAADLGIGRRTLNEKIVKLGLDKDALL